MHHYLHRVINNMSVLVLGAQSLRPVCLNEGELVVVTSRDLVVHFVIAPVRGVEPAERLRLDKTVRLELLLQLTKVIIH